MKKIALLSSLLAVGLLSHAQYDNIKNKLLLSSTKAYEDAKTDVDKKMTNAKFASKAEAFVLKATIYSFLAADSTYKVTGRAEGLQADAETALETYLKMDATQDLLKDPIYKNAPVYVYSNLFDAGYKLYTDEKYAESFKYFEKVNGYSELLSKHQLLNSPVDTNALILAAYTAEMSDQKDNAAKYYARLADAKVARSTDESIYRFLVTYYFQKGDMTNFEKYKAIGGEMYPKSEFFTYDQVDFAVGLETDWNKKFEKLNEQLKNDPTNYKANLAVVELAFDALQQTMVTALDNMIKAKPDDELAYLIKGDHFVNESIIFDKKREEHAADMKKRTKPGSSASKEDIAKRDQLDTEYARIFEKSLEPYEKACEIYAKKGTLNANDKQQYKKAAGYLGDIYTMKSVRSKGKPADISKFDALAKKWNDLYGSIR